MGFFVGQCYLLARGRCPRWSQSDLPPLPLSGLDHYGRPGGVLVALDDPDRIDYVDYMRSPPLGGRSLAGARSFLLVVY